MLPVSRYREARSVCLVHERGPSVIPTDETGVWVTNDPSYFTRPQQLSSRFWVHGKYPPL